MTITTRIAWRMALRLARKRQARPWATVPSERKVLLVLPARELEARPAWRFVHTLGLNPELTLPVVPTGEIAYAPVDYLGRVMPFNSSDLNRVGLPKKKYRNAVWDFQPDVAMALTAPFDLASAVLVGASSAAFRIGFAADGAEAFFDLMVSGEGVEGGMRALSEAMRRVHPPIIEPHTREGTAGGRAAW